MNGVEVTRENPQPLSAITVIGLSVNAAVENQEAMKRAGAATLLRKEVAFEQLHDAIARR